jgi:predicted small secreted protein
MKTTTTLVMAVSLSLASCNAMRGPADIQVLKESRPLGETKELAVDLKYDVGQLEVSRASEGLFSFDLQYDRNRGEPKFTFDEGSRASMHLDLNSHGGSFGSNSRDGDNDLTFRLTDQIPIDLNLTTAVSDSRLEMTGIKLRKLRLRAGVGKMEMSFDKSSGQVLESLEVESGVGELIIHGLGNAQVQDVDFKGGVGHAELDFTGDLGSSRTEARVKVGIGEVRLSIPREADVEIEAQGSFLSNISAPSFEHNGRSYTHHGGGGATIKIRVESGVGSVAIELI